MATTKILTHGAKHGMVLQGFFRVERFRAQAAAIVQPKAPDFWANKAPRPELMPMKMQRSAVQPKAVSASPSVSAWPGAPCPELLPGMGRARFAPLPAVAQGRTADGLTISPVPDGMLRLPGNGKPLDDGIRAKMESFFNADFSGVRVYEGQAAQAMGALAFTLGDTLYFVPGLYDPTTRAGVDLLGHELTHVVQQRAGRVANPYGRGVAIVQDPSLEAEAKAMGRQLAGQLRMNERAAHHTLNSQATQPRLAVAQAMESELPSVASSSDSLHSKKAFGTDFTDSPFIYLDREADSFDDDIRTFYKKSLNNDRPLALYRVVGDEELKQLIETIQLNKIPLFKHRGDRGEKFFGTNKRYVWGQWSQKGERGKDPTLLRIVLASKVRKEFLHNTEYACLNESAEREVPELKLKKSSKGANLVILKTESKDGKFWSTSLTYGFGSNESLAILSRYITAIQVVSKEECEYIKDNNSRTPQHKYWEELY